MKQFKIAVIALFTLVTVSNVSAQDASNPWAVSAGVTVVDVKGGNSISNVLKDYFGTGDWEFGVPRITGERYLNEDFTAQLALSYAKVNSNTYLSADANVKYSLNKLSEMVFGSTTQYFDPYILAGAGMTHLYGNKFLTVNAGWGVTSWIDENYGINFQSGLKQAFGSNRVSHYQHSLGVVYRFGAVDTDGDGVVDKDDACPDVAGLAAFNGCPDTDGDGVQDSEDACVNVAGLASLNGCPDADGDGIADKDDMCPDAKGSAANNGCPDSDGDGVVDRDDKCPNVAGPVANGGCPWPDTDGDGVLDKDDNCPNEAGVASNNGCPEPVITDAAAKELEDFAKSILFNSGRTTFKTGVSAKLDQVVELMNKFPRANFIIEGHTDSTGTDAVNLKVSDKRAKAVRDYLVKNGVDASRLESKGFGEMYPIADNKTSAGRAKNRRVVIKVVE
ncbi:cell envelope biogenesis protein OmpA [Polaribacter pacificus]|uniref:Cell envelope biogenesis protein OmpA n=1 Tax=Polaribacter pacificus TaxID=1775173 RepID=A0A917MD39_9FLAO|nr:OmpA family protein [Polaribacter pacificus]GGG93850.1 cell envelope biogenesis protein OmpA [Polaribacter pacificus]